MSNKDKIWPLDWASLLEALSDHELEVKYEQAANVIRRILFADNYGMVHVYQLDQGCCGLCVIVWDAYLVDEILQVFAEARKSKYFDEMQLHVAVISEASKVAAQKAEHTEKPGFTTE